ncbi:MAG: TIGR02147 family protein [Bdellovibrionota bacterium]
MTNKELYRHYLNSEFARRCEANPAYSLRSFALALCVDAGTLSRILNGKQALSYKMAQKIVDKLDLSPDQQKEFFSSLFHYQQSRKLEKVHEKNVNEAEYKGADLSVEYYRVIADWYHIALMEMTYLKSFKPDSRYLAQQLGITQAEAKLALERLLKLGLLTKKNGKVIKTNEKLSTTDRHLTTPALRKNQKQFLEKAIYSLENDSLEVRSNTNMTMAIDSSKIEIAKKMIREFQMTLCNFLESGKQDQVYNLSVALYPLQNNKQKPKE